MAKKQNESLLQGFLVLSYFLLVQSFTFPQVELNSLFDLFSSTNGDEWTWRTNYTSDGIPWNFSQPNPNPCIEKWQGIVCTANISQPYHVYNLNLDMFNLEGSIPQSIGNLTLLEYLDLSYNSITGTIPTTFGNMRYCKEMVLSFNYLHGSIPESLTTLHMLDVFDIENNQLTGTLPAQIFTSSYLSTFLVNHNQLNGSVPNRFTNLKNVLYLYLSYNQFTGSIPAELMGNMTNMLQMELSYNHFQGKIPDTIGKQTNAIYLSVESNNLHGPIPASMGNMSQMYIVSLEINTFSGTLPSSLQNMKAMQEFYLRDNQLEGKVLELFVEFPYLSYVDVCENQFSGTIPSNWNTLSYLVGVFLCENKFDGTVPNIFGRTPYIEYVDISYNNFTGTLPESLAQTYYLSYLYCNNNNLHGTLPNTEWRYMIIFDGFYNQFSGTIPSTFMKMKYLQYLLFGSNNLNGALPNGWSQLPQLLYLHLDRNKLTGNIPEDLYEAKALQKLYLTLNYLTGTVSSKIGQLVNLKSLYIDRNILHGTLPYEIGKLTKLIDFGVFDNSLTGTIPESIGQLKQVQTFLAYENNFNGTLPQSIGELENLSLFSICTNSFTGTISDSVGNYSLLTLFQSNDNYFIGSIPQLFFAMKQNQYLFIEENFFTGNINPLSSMEQLLNLNISTNFFDGSVSSIFQTMPFLINVDLSLNSFSGSIHNSFANMPYLSLLILRDNAFTGSLDQLTNTTLQQALTVIDVSDNQFTGSLPADPFHSPLLVSFAAVKNCITGSIPEIICANEQLRTVALDGLHTAESCQDRFFPTIREIESYALNTNLPGGLPGCLFNMSSLETLHLSGNGIAGKIPEDISIGKNLKDLSLSYNQLSGRIPSLIQEHGWTNLDLSFNKLDGVLSSTFAVPGNTSSLTLSVNRLSGSIPSSLLDAEQIDILKGNVFSCEKDRGSSGFSWSLPKHDNHASSYDCGSDAVNTSLYIWLGLIFVIVVGVILLWKLSRRRRKQQSSNEEVQTMERSSWGILVIDRGLVRLKQWYAVTNEASEALVESDHVGDRKSNKKRLYILGRSMRVLRKLSVLIALFAVLVLMPMYGILTVYYGSHTYSYAWTVSLAYLSGLTAAMILMTVLVIFYVWLVWVVGVLKAEMKGPVMNSTSDSRSNTSSHLVSHLDHSTLERLQQTNETIGKNSSLWEIQVSYEWKLFLSIWWLKGKLWMFNVTFVMMVNISYVYITTLSLSSNSMTLIILAISVFKICWGMVVVSRWIKRYLYEELEKLRKYDDTVVAATGIGARSKNHVMLDEMHTVQFLIHLQIFNSIVAPFLADAFIDPNCFYYVIDSPSAVSVSYFTSVCTRFAVSVNSITCTSTNMVKYGESFTPPFEYSFQCSSSLLSDFVTVFIYRYIFSGILGPAYACFLHMLRLRGLSGWEVSTSWIRICFRQPRQEAKSADLEMHTKKDSETSSDIVITPMAHRDTVNEDVNHDGSIFQKEQFVTNYVGDLAVMLTFGLSFPPLCLVILFSIVSNSLTQQIIIGKNDIALRQHKSHIAHINEDSNQCVKMENNQTIATQEQQQRATSATDSNDTTSYCDWESLLELVWPALPTISILSAGFVGFFLFDTLGDQVGVMRSFWILLFMTFIPVVVWKAFGEWRKRRSKSSISAKSTSKRMESVEIENSQHVQMNPITAVH